MKRLDWDPNHGMRDGFKMIKMFQIEEFQNFQSNAYDHQQPACSQTFP